MMNKERVDHEVCGPKCISWSAIIVGALVMTGLSFLLNLFCIALGLTGFAPTETGIMTVAIGGFVGLSIAAVVAMFVGGWVAGGLARMYCKNYCMGSLYGFGAWCLALILAMFLASNLDNFVAAQRKTLSQPYTDVSVTTDRSAPMVSERKTASPTTGGTQTQVTVNQEKAANFLGKSLLATFFIFFLGALSAAFGGYFGIRSRCGEEERP